MPKHPASTDSKALDRIRGALFQEVEPREEGPNNYQ